MEFSQPLSPGRLIGRYKRFLADVELETGEVVTAHCANPGAMLGVAEPGSRVWLEPATNPARKLRWSWRLIELPGEHWAGIDTGVPNKVVGEALRAGRIAPFAAYGRIAAEQRYRQNSRVDFLASADGCPDAYIEVKNVHLRRAGTWAEFPDSVTARGAKHMDDLAAMVGEGHRAAVLFCVQRTDCDALRLAGDLDPAYVTACRRAAEAGVEAYAYSCKIGIGGISLDRPLPVEI